MKLVDYQRNQMAYRAVCRPSVVHPVVISKTKQDRPIVTMKHY